MKKWTLLRHIQNRITAVRNGGLLRFYTVPPRGGYMPQHPSAYLLGIFLFYFFWGLHNSVMLVMCCCCTWCCFFGVYKAIWPHYFITRPVFV